LWERWNSYNRWWTAEDPDKTSWIMWDVAIIEAMIHPEWASIKEFPAIPMHADKKIEAYTAIDVQAMRQDFWKCLESISP
jgi:hypothetical protein